MDFEISSNSVPFSKYLKFLLHLVLFGFFLTTRWGQAAGRPGHRSSRLSVDIPDFISFDCGAPEDYIDNTTGVPYKSDKYFIDSGVSNPTNSSEKYQKLPSQFNYLRSFPDGRRNCYTLKPIAGKFNSYLIRASFFYGNYDGKFQPSEFDLFLGVNLWKTVKWEKEEAKRKQIEINLFPSTDFIDICLVNTGKGVPFISALELRRLDNSIYHISNGYFLALSNRYDVGGLDRGDIRYSEDVYDRIWKPIQLNTSSLISTNATINMSKEDPYKLPKLMLKTAGKSQNSTSPLTYAWKPNEGSFGFLFCFHFAEIEKLEEGQIREIKIGLNGVHNIADSVKLEYLRPKTVCSKTLPVDVGKQNYLTVSSTSGSHFPPILSGIEVFAVRELSNSSTFLQDLNAVREVKKKYKVGKNWQGDPCNPSTLSWNGLTCNDENPFRIISLNLSGSKLTGDIAISFFNLTALESLDLSENELIGPLPEFLAYLPRLKTLNLMGNNFTGLVPEALIQKSNNGTLILSLDRNPELCLSIPCKNKKKILLPALSSVIAATILIILFSFIVILTRKGRVIGIYFESMRRRRLELKNRHFSYLEVLSITDNFKTIIGSGGFGKVYLGKLKDQTLVAVKLLSASSNQGYNEFQAEARLLMIVHHRNLVSLVGYCDEDNNKALIYEFMENGNVHQHISERSTHVLNWIERLQIAVDTAQGLEYLHNGCKPPIIHRDMKTSNILLNGKMQAKIADFGLSRTLASESASHLSITQLAGTFGYIDPEIHSSGNFTKKSDVYSFGVVLLELITSKPAIIWGEEYSIHILSWIKPLIEQGNIENIVDSRLRVGNENGSIWKAMEVAIACTLPSSDQRPDMSCVVMELTECLKMVQCTTQEIQSRNFEDWSCASIGSDSILTPR